MSALTEFYDGFGTCSSHTINEIWAKNDDFWEYSHDYIQWLFPLPEPSNFNPDAPLLTEDDIKIFKANPTIRCNFLTSFIRFINFLGLDYQSDQVITTEKFEPILFKFPNHNWFRITRVLNSCRLLGFENEAVALFNFLKKMHEEYGWVSNNSFSYWKEAVNGLVD